MDTVNDMLHFLIKLDFAGYLKSGDYEKFNCIKKVLTDEIQDINSEKLINMLGFIDDLHILIITQDFHDVQILTSILRGGIILLVKEKWKVNNFVLFQFLAYILSYINLIIPHQFHIHNIDFYFCPHLLIKYE